MNTARTAPVLRLGGWGGVLTVAAALAATLIASVALAAPKFPPLTGRVVDNAQILSPATEAKLTGELADLEARTGRQVVVATVPDLQGYEIEDFGYQLGRAWRIGSKDKDDGVVFLVAPSDRAVRIEVGYGLEPVLTDALSSVILQEQVLPAFREGRMEAGVEAGTAAIVHQLALPEDEAKARVAEASARSTKDREGGAFVTLFVIFLVLWILSGVLRGFGRRGRRGGIPWWVWPLIMSGGGGGGHRGGGSFGGGGFSGGGGSFGGGGASGRW